MKKVKRYRVRFHLAKGENFMKWQVFDKLHNLKEYYSPDEWSLVMDDCTLGNHPSTAKKIYEGADKTVCAWIACNKVTASSQAPSTDSCTQFKYNPKKNPHWFTDNNPNVDGMTFTTMITKNKQVYA